MTAIFSQSNYNPGKERSKGGKVSEELPGEVWLKQLLDIGLNFTEGLIKEKERGIYGLKDQSDNFKQYLAKLTLERLNKLYQDAEKKDLETADSIRLFGELYGRVKQELPPQDQELQEKDLSDRLNSIFGQLSIYDDEPSDQINIDLIRGFASQLIPNNPTTISPDLYRSNY